jgi:hypothetical protein
MIINIVTAVETSNLKNSSVGREPIFRGELSTEAEK